MNESELRALVAEEVGPWPLARTACRRRGACCRRLFTVGGLHASAPTIRGKPQMPTGRGELDAEFERVVHRLGDGIALLEHDAGVPEWMTEPTTNALYGAAELLGEGAIASATFLRDGNRMTIARQTYRTLDRVPHETTEAIGSVRVCSSPRRCTTGRMSP